MDEQIRELCKRAAAEQDSEKLRLLMKEITDLIKEQDRRKNETPTED